jgi:hypothetical protein
MCNRAFWLLLNSTEAPSGRASARSPRASASAARPPAASAVRGIFPWSSVKAVSAFVARLESHSYGRRAPSASSALGQTLRAVAAPKAEYVARATAVERQATVMTRSARLKQGKTPCGSHRNRPPSSRRFLSD